MVSFHTIGMRNLGELELQEIHLGTDKARLEKSKQNI